MFYSNNLNIFSSAAERDARVEELAATTAKSVRRLREAGASNDRIKPFRLLANEIENIRWMTEHAPFVINYFGQNENRQLVGRTITGFDSVPARGPLTGEDRARFERDVDSIDYLIEIDGVPLYWRTQGHRVIVEGDYGPYVEQAAEDVRGWLSNADGWL